MSESINIKVSDSAIADTQFKIRVGLSLTIAASIGAITLARWLFDREITSNSWKFLLIAAIPAYLTLYLISKFAARKPRFNSVQFFPDGLYFPPLTEAKIPWQEIDAIQISTDTQNGTGQYVQIDIKRDYYKKIQSSVFNFAKDEPKRIFTCNIAFHLGVLEQSEFSFEQLVDRLAPNLKRIVSS
jgi:hypothetical protein